MNSLKKISGKKRKKSLKNEDLPPSVTRSKNLNDCPEKKRKKNMNSHAKADLACRSPNFQT